MHKQIEALEKKVDEGNRNLHLILQELRYTRKPFHTERINKKRRRNALGRNKLDDDDGDDG